MAADPQPPPGHLAIYIPAEAITRAITGSAREWGDPLAQAMRRLEPQITQAVQAELGRLLQEDANDLAMTLPREHTPRALWMKERIQAHLELHLIARPERGENDADV